MTGPRERVQRLTAAAARRFGAAREPALVRALAAETGLSHAGVTLALDRALEIAPAPEEIERMCARAKPTESVLVVLAANVFTAPLRAIAWALASSARVTVRPSRRAVVLVDALLDGAAELGVVRATLGDDPADDVRKALASSIHLYGARATVESIVRLGLPAELHGPGFGAIVARSEEIVAHADAVAEDVVLFDQRGCLSPRICLVVGSATEAADALHVALGRLGARVPRGRLSTEEASAVVRMRDSAIVAGRALEGDGHLVMELEVKTLAPVGRVLPVVAVRSVEDAIAWLSIQAELTTVGTSSASASQLSQALPGVRVALLGRMQQPPFDGPVDLRVLR